jgi:Tol biopolymer transport system component
MPRILAIIICGAFLAEPLALAVITKPVITPWIRIRDTAQHISIAPKEERFMAFTGSNGQRLQVMDIRTKKVYLVSKHMVGQGFFWAPDGLRLFYRQLKKGKNNEIESTVNAFDMITFKSVELAHYPLPTSDLTFDPRDLRMHLLSKNGFHTKRIFFPDQRLAQWQVAQRNQTGKWLPTDTGMLWVTEGGYAMRPMADDGSGLQSFSVSPDGTSATWATKKGLVYMSIEGNETRKLGFGIDPTWHPLKPYILMAGSRMVGDKAVDYDLKIVDQNGSSKYLTYTQGIAERWPAWTPDGKSIVYTKDGTTDIFRLEFAENL